MARLCLTAEGQTEQTFAARLLTPHLASLGVYLAKARRPLTSKKKGTRGGLFRYRVVRDDIGRWLKEDRAADVWFSTMFDLYKLPKDFPGYSETRAEPDPLVRVDKLETAFAEDVNDSRFIPYIQLHEFEALLLSDPTAFGCYYTRHAKEIAALVKLAEALDAPERIDDGEQTAPSKRIGKEIPDYLDAKATAGPIIAMEIGLKTIRAKCPHFHQWLTKLEGLATLSAYNP